MKSISGTVKRIQNITYVMLCDIDDFCRKNNIKYFLSGGTCLGAIRHKGFIPWDDDADIMLPRPDYERFLSLFPNEFHGKYKIGSVIENNSWTRPFTQVWDPKTIIVNTKVKDEIKGVMVDIFPIDGLPDSKLAQKIYYKRLKFLDVLRNLKRRKDFYDYEKYILLKKILGKVLFFINVNKIVSRMNNLAKNYDFCKSKYVAVSLALHYWEKETITKKAFDRTKFVKFCDRLFPVPIGYDKYLKNLYGDYMRIPKDVAKTGKTHLNNNWEITFDDDSK